LLFHQPTDEVEVGLAELNAVLTGAVAVAQAQLKVAEAIVTKDLLDDRGGVEIQYSILVETPIQSLHQNERSGNLIENINKTHLKQC
jgi:hypothetical protein